MNAYYNEHDPFAAAWLRALIADGLITPGVVDERDIQLVQPSDLAGFTRCHFFAGIGGWDLALQLAGWPAGRPVWTGSCPCQPFSSAGKGGGFDDSRHLWPTWFRLIRECRPPVVFGEQVAQANGLGWFDTVSTDLETEDYSVGAADLAAGCVAPHGRQRLFFVADAPGARSEVGESEASSPARERSGRLSEPDGRRVPDRPVGHSEGIDWGLPVQQRRSQPTLPESRGPGHWADPTWIECMDGRRRAIPTEPGLFPLAHGVPNRVGTLRGAGNAIVPQVAAEFISAYREAVIA